MTTVVEKTIGTGGDYPDLNAWFTAAPASLVSADQVWRAKLLKQKHTVGVVITGKTVDATRYFEITTADGASIFDAPISTLRYDPTLGAALETSSNSYNPLTISLAYTRVSKLQIGVVGTGANSSAALNVTTGSCSIDRCIVEGYSQNPTLPFPLRMVGNSVISNSLIVQRAPGATNAIATMTYGAKAVNCTMVSINGKLANALRTQGIAAELVNCYFGNVTAVEDGVIAATKTNCYSDSGSTGYTLAPFSTVTFTNIADGTYDFRLPASSVLINAGTQNTIAAISISGTPRPYGAAYDVGAWEYSVVDTVAPVLSLPTGAFSSATSATGTVASDEAGGLLYYMASSNATESATTVKAGSSQSVTATGSQTVTFTGLTPGATYYAHYVQVDTAGNTSNVVNSGSFTMPTVDNIAPVFAAGAVITKGTTTHNSLSYSYPAATDNVATAGYETSKDGGATWQNNGTGLTANFAGLSAQTTYTVAVRAYDAQGNYSAPLTLAITTSAAPAAATGSFKTRQLANNTGSAYASGTVVAWQWHAAARIGTAAASITYGSGTLGADGSLTITGLPLGNGFLLAAILGTTLDADKPYYQSGTVA